LLSEIIHNPWVNNYFQQRGVKLLAGEQLDRLEDYIGRGDCAVIPAFGVTLEIEQRLAKIGCRILDTSCGDVRRLWLWATRSAQQGFGVLIFGRATHDETVVTKSRLAAVGGKYVVAGNLSQVQAICDMITGDMPPGYFPRLFNEQATNAETIEPFLHLAQVSQTTMLYNDTMTVRQLISEAFEKRFGRNELDDRLLFEPTVCRATQDRQSAAVELCRGGCDLVIVVGGFGSSNTRHLYELARSYAPAWFIEDADAIHSADELRSLDAETNRLTLVHGWLPTRRPLRIGVLAGASSPEIVVGKVIQRLAEFLS